MDFYQYNPEYEDNLMLADEAGLRVTYGGYDIFYQTVAERLRERTLLFLFCENTAGSVLFYMTCLRRKIVPLLLDRGMDEALRKRLISIYEPDYLAFPAEMSLENENAEWSPVAAGYGYLVMEREKKMPTKLHEDLALLLTTSGSTGSPKLVRQSRRNIQSNAESIREYLKLDSSERAITTLPMNYTYGLSIMNSHFLCGAAVLLTTHTLFEREFWEFFKGEGATSFGGVPYTYEMLKRLEFFKMDLPSLRTMTQAGGKLAPRLHEEFASYAKNTGRKFVVMYGQTEATARMGYLPSEFSLAKCGSMGIAIPGGRFRLMEDEKTEILEPNKVGELVYEGENVTMGYAGSAEDLEKGDERGGVLFTGDMAKRDQDGFYYITGRKKRFLKMFGKRVNLDEIEQLLKQEYEDLEAACTGEDDRMRIYVAGRSEKFCEEAADWLTGKTGLHPGAAKVLSIEEIPKKESGKTDYTKLL